MPNDSCSKDKCHYIQHVMDSNARNKKKKKHFFFSKYEIDNANKSKFKTKKPLKFYLSQLLDYLTRDGETTNIKIGNQIEPHQLKCEEYFVMKLSE